MKRLHGFKLGASDGAIGHVKDFYFDSSAWTVRYLVADTGSWIQGRQVLLSPRAFGKLDPDEKLLHVNLTREQIEWSPPIESHKPISRRYEEQYHEYYGWPYYWLGDPVWGMSGVPILTELPEHFVGEQTMETFGKEKSFDADLRSANVVGRYKVQARDELVGHVTDFIVDDKNWAIDYLAVHTGAWVSGKNVLITPRQIERISWNESKVFVELSRDELLQAPVYDESSLNAEREVAAAHQMTIFL
jgi:hypothetical protein